MAAKKKTFDAVAASRSWRVATARKLRRLTFKQQQELLHRSTNEIFSAKTRRPVRALKRG
jgi:hypothetical protein